MLGPRVTSAKLCCQQPAALQALMAALKPVSVGETQQKCIASVLPHVSIIPSVALPPALALHGGDHLWANKIDKVSQRKAGLHHQNKGTGAGFCTPTIAASWRVQNLNLQTSAGLLHPRLGVKTPESMTFHQ